MTASLYIEGDDLPPSDTAVSNGVVTSLVLLATAWQPPSTASGTVWLEAWQARSASDGGNDDHRLVELELPLQQVKWFSARDRNYHD